MSGTFLLGASHRNNQHCLGAVLANLRYRSWNVPAGALGPHQPLMRTPVLLPRGVLGAPVLLTYPQMGGGSRRERIQGQIRSSQVRDHSVRHFGPYAVLLVCWPSGLSVQRRHFELIAFGVDPLAFHMVLR